MPEQRGNSLVTTVLEQLETVYTERKTVSLPSPAKHIYDARLKNCKIFSQVINKTVQIKCEITIDAVYIEESSKALKLFSWAWEIIVFVRRKENVAGTHCKTKLLDDSVIHTILLKPNELTIDTRLHFAVSILKEAMVAKDQKTGRRDQEFQIRRSEEGPIEVLQGIGTIQFEIE